MKRTISVALVASLLIGCGKQAGLPKRTEENLPPDDICATVQGKVRYVGVPPVLSKLPVEANPECAQHYQGVTAYQEDVVVRNGALANVFVYVKSGLDAKWKFKTPGEPVVITNEKCVYRPRVSGAMHAQDVKFVNEDSLQHNIHAWLPNGGDGFNQSLFSKGQSFTQQLAAPQVMVQLKCDLHTWMTGWLGVLDHPYFAVTKEDGSWQFPRKLPEGSYVIEAWQEKLGTKTVTVAVKKGGTVTVPDISFP